MTSLFFVISLLNILQSFDCTWWTTMVQRSDWCCIRWRFVFGNKKRKVKVCCWRFGEGWLREFYNYECCDPTRFVGGWVVILFFGEVNGLCFAGLILLMRSYGDALILKWITKEEKLCWWNWIVVSRIRFSSWWQCCLVCYTTMKICEFCYGDAICKVDLEG